jgi:formylmethanofuran dehydrogenase subunit E
VNEEKEVRKSGDYKAVYPQWPGYLAKIQNIHDTKEVILQPKEKEEANADKSICDYCGEKLILS